MCLQRRYVWTLNLFGIRPTATGRKRTKAWAWWDRISLFNWTCWGFYGSELNHNFAIFGKITLWTNQLSHECCMVNLWTLRLIWACTTCLTRHSSTLLCPPHGRPSILCDSPTLFWTWKSSVNGHVTVAETPPGYLTALSLEPSRDMIPGVVYDRTMVVPIPTTRALTRSSSHFGPLS